MPDDDTEITSQTWGQRLLGSLVTAIVGLILVPATVVLLYCNESQTIDAERAPGRGAATIVEISASQIDPQTVGKLVHVSGLLQSANSARDPVFDVTAGGVLRLARTLEMYQWKEVPSTQSQQSLGGSQTTQTTYTYERVWSAQPIASDRFKGPDDHRNPPMRQQSTTFNAFWVMLGAYRVDPALLDRLNAFVPYPVQNTTPLPGYRNVAGGFYRGQDPNQPMIGDTRVSYAAVPAQVVSIAGGQASGTITAYRDTNNQTIALAEPGIVTASALFRDEQRADSTLTWVLRAVGYVAMLIGFVGLTRRRRAVPHPLAAPQRIAPNE